MGYKILSQAIREKRKPEEILFCDDWFLSKKSWRGVYQLYISLKGGLHMIWIEWILWEKYSALQTDLFVHKMLIQIFYNEKVLVRVIKIWCSTEDTIKKIQKTMFMMCGRGFVAMFKMRVLKTIKYRVMNQCICCTVYIMGNLMKDFRQRFMLGRNQIQKTDAQSDTLGESHSDILFLFWFHCVCRFL